MGSTGPPITRSPTANPVTPGPPPDLAAQLDARGERQRRADLVLPRHISTSGKFAAAPEHPHQHLPGPGFRVGHLGQRQHVARLAQLAHLPGPHAASLTSSIRCCIRFIPRSHLSVSLARSS